MGIFRNSSEEHSDRSANDRRRHRQLVREAMKENIADVIAEEAIIGQDKTKKIKVPIRGIKEFRFVFGDNKGVGSGGSNDGNAPQKGQKIPVRSKQEGKAGDRPGEDAYETETTLEELIDLVFEDLQLPDMDKKKLRETFTLVRKKRKGYRKVGIRVRLDKYRTMRNKIREEVAAKLKRPFDSDESLIVNAEEFGMLEPHWKKHFYPLQGTNPQLYQFRTPINPQRHVRYKHVVQDIKKESNAVVICIMDVSGSMDTMKKYLARVFFFLLYSFVSTRYQNVEVVFIAHHTEAKEVTQDEFFHKAESGGTFISSGYAKALEIIEERYHPALWNIYAFHCSDGDNFESDNQNAVKKARELCEVANLFGYGEIKPLESRYYESSMLTIFKALSDLDNFVSVVIGKKEEVLPSLKKLLDADRVKEAV